MNEIDLSKMLKEKSLDFNINLDEEKLEKFRVYYEFLREYNSRVNLVSSAEPLEVYLKHFLDSLSIGLAGDKISFKEEKTIIDIGIGGGFPGIPIIIAFPVWKLCAVDSVGKKLEFIRLLCNELRVSDRVEIVNARAEELARASDKRENFDIAVTRAVSSMSIISEYCLPFVKKGGYFLAYKAKTAAKELKESEKAVSLLGGKYVSSYNYTLSGEEERNLILIEKTALIPDKYPRKSGIPSKRPLC